MKPFETEVFTKCVFLLLPQVPKHNVTKFVWQSLGWHSNISVNNYLALSFSKMKFYGAICPCGWRIAEGLERLASNIVVMSSNPGVSTWSRRPNSCDERGLSGCKKGFKSEALAQTLLSQNLHKPQFAPDDNYLHSHCLTKFYYFLQARFAG